MVTGGREHRTTPLPGDLPWPLAYPGYLVVLNLCALVASMLLVTAPAAAVAAQVTLHRWWHLDDTRIIGNFVREFRRQTPRMLGVGAVVLALVAVLAVAVQFWLGVPGPGRFAALLCLATLGVTFLAGWLAGLEVAAHSPTSPVRTWLRSLPSVLFARPGRAAATVVLLLTWLAAVGSEPLLALAGGFVVPAMLARWAFQPAAAALAQTSDSDDGASQA